MKKQLATSGCLALLLSSTMSLNAAEIACEYDANEEWPQPADKVCQSQEPLQPTLLANDDSSRLSRWPHCSDPRFDSDGDGWGWENNASCIANSQSPVITANTTSVTTVASAATSAAVCLQAGTDPDGDGWGWENDASCVVQAPAPVSHPICSSAASDSNGDGWGWEYNTSCVVASP